MHGHSPIADDYSIWLIDLAKQHSQAHFDGFDISSAQFPHPAWLPRNSTLGILDLLKPIPEHLHGQYDIVHVGLIVLVVQYDDPLPVLDNLLKLLSKNLTLSGLFELT